jgi:hypothetical protein
MPNPVWHNGSYKNIARISAYHGGQWKQSTARYVWHLGAWLPFDDQPYLPPLVNGTVQGAGAGTWTVPANIGRAQLLFNAKMQYDGGQSKWADQLQPPVLAGGGGRIVVSFDVVPGEQFSIHTDPMFLPTSAGAPTQANVWVVLGLVGGPGKDRDPCRGLAAGGGDEGASGEGGGGTQTHGGAAGSWQNYPSESPPGAGGPLKGGAAGVDRDDEQGNITGHGAAGGFGWFGGGGSGGRGNRSPGGGGSSRIQIPADRNPVISENARGVGDYKDQWGRDQSFGWQITF